MKIDFTKVKIDADIANMLFNLGVEKEDNTHKINLKVSSDVVTGEANVSVSSDKKSDE